MIRRFLLSIPSFFSAIREEEITKKGGNKVTRIHKEYMYIKGNIDAYVLESNRRLLPTRIRRCHKTRRNRRWKRVDSIVAKALSKQKRAMEKALSLDACI